MYRNNKKLLYLLFSLLVIANFASCERELDTPPINSLDPNLIPNTTIGELLALYDGSKDFVTIEDNIILEAIVVANDESGNFYRQLIIQDATAGVELKINSNNLYEQYALGQKLYIKAQNLILGSYGGITQLGGTTYDSGGLRLGGIEADNLANHLFRIPGGEIPEPTLISLDEDLDEYIYTTVRLTNVQFISSNLGKTYAEPNQTTNRYITDCSGNTIIVRTSSFADFAASTLPEGNGSITAVLTKFVNDYQLIINDINDLDLTGTLCEIAGSPEGTGTFADPFNVSAAFSSNTGSGVWVTGYIVGVRETDVDPFVNNFTPPFRGNTNIILADAPDQTDASKLLMVQLPIGDVRDAINLVSNPANKGKLVKLRGNLTAYFGFPGMRDTYQYWMAGMPDPDPDPTPVATVFEEVFASGLGAFTDFNILGSQGWNRVTFDGGAASINGYVQGSSNANENWLISPSISLSGRENVKLQIREAINFITSLNDLKVMVSANFDGSNPTKSGDWVHFTGFTRPPGTNWTFVDSGDIDISQFDGQTIHIAFKYTSTTSGSSAWQISRVKVVADE